MKVKMRKQYYCDFCKKNGGSKYHLQRHEKSCTGNPDRECRMCHLLGGPVHTVKELIDILGSGGEEGLKRLREATENCPMCILAALRQSGINDIDDEGFPGKGAVSFDFHKERDEAFASIQASRDEEHDCWPY